MSARLVHLSGLLLGAALAIGAAGCDPFTSVSFEAHTPTPDGDRLEFEGIRLTEGRAIGVVATPMEGDQPMDDDTVLELSTHDNGVADIEKSVQKNMFVVFGVGHGQTSFDVVVNGTREAEIPVTVTEAP